MRRPVIRRGFHLAPGPLGDLIRQNLGPAVRAADGLWRKDPSAWTTEAAVAEKIANRLGWLDVTHLMEQSLERLRAVGDTAVSDGFEDVVLLGMGGSSLAPEVLRAVVGVRSDRPRLHMLDSTDPAAVGAISIDPRRTLFLLASKSGTTIEPNSLAAHFRQTLETAGVARWADHFVAITDGGTELATRARDQHFRDTFINPSNIGGRYSALSFFGLVPAALMGQDLEAIVGWGAAMFEEAQSPVDDVTSNPAVGLGLFMAAAARAGRDKLTLVLPPLLEPLGLWVEQLVAESTGKQGVGIVPIAGEALGGRRVYGDDRAFVRLRTVDDPNEERIDLAMRTLSDAPIVTIDFPEPAAIGAEFARWEIATAVAGALLAINPFDEPNVQQAKDATNRLLDRFKADGHLPSSAADETLGGGTSVAASGAARRALGSSPASAVTSLLSAGDYLAVLAYLGPDAALRDVMHRFRMSVRDRAAVATMFGYGPRYLHSTGQLHKGGPNTGVFVLITAAPYADLPIPGQPFTFGTLEHAQALGDFASLDATSRRAVHVHLPTPDPLHLEQALARLLEHAPAPASASA